MKYLLQFTTTEPGKWQSVEATNREAAIIKALRPIVKGKPTALWPYVANVALGESRHTNGAPICVQSFHLHLTENKANCL